MNTQIKIALIDDESLFLEGLSLLLSSSGNLCIVGQATNGADFLQLLENYSIEEFPDILMVDLQMQPMDGFELVAKIKAKHTEAKVIVLSSYYKQAMFGHMIQMGVSAFLPKNAPKDLLLEALTSVHKTGVFLSDEDQEMLVEYVANRKKYNSNSMSETLTDRELEIVNLICLELTNQEIADRLYLSKRTVESHRQRILEKIGAKNTVGIVIFAIAHQLYTSTKY